MHWNSPTHLRCRYWGSGHLPQIGRQFLCRDCYFEPCPTSALENKKLGFLFRGEKDSARTRQRGILRICGIPIDISGAMTDQFQGNNKSASIKKVSGSSMLQESTTTAACLKRSFTTQKDLDRKTQASNTRREVNRISRAKLVFLREIGCGLHLKREGT